MFSQHTSNTPHGLTIKVDRSNVICSVSSNSYLFISCRFSPSMISCMDMKQLAPSLSFLQANTSSGVDLWNFAMLWIQVNIMKNSYLLCPLLTSSITSNSFFMTPTSTATFFIIMIITVDFMIPKYIDFHLINQSIKLHKLHSCHTLLLQNLKLMLWKATSKFSVTAHKTV